MVADQKDNMVSADGASQLKPGDTIAPGSSSAPAVQPLPAQESKPSQASAPESKPEPDLPPAAPPPENSLPSDAPMPSENGSVSWTASEFIAHEKSANWYLTLIVAAVAIAGLIFLTTKDIITAIVVIVGALFLGIYGSRRPRQLQYQVSPSGITIGARHYSYNAFRCFSVSAEGAFSGITLMPLKRFAPAITIYYAPEDEDRIIDLLSERLPFEEQGNDLVDQLMRRIRF